MNKASAPPAARPARLDHWTRRTCYSRWVAGGPARARASIRFSLGIYNTDAEVDFVLKQLPPIIAQVLRMHSRKVLTARPSHDNHPLKMNVLQIVKLELQAVEGISVSEGGTPAAKTLYARSATRAVKVSTQDASLVVEFWNSVDEQSQIPPVSREIVPSVAKAVGEQSLTGCFADNKSTSRFCRHETLK